MFGVVTYLQMIQIHIVHNDKKKILIDIVLKKKKKLFRGSEHKMYGAYIRTDIEKY